MDISGVISISGKPGLYKVLARSKNGLVIEGLIDKKRIPAHATNKISALEDISMYTYDDEVPLKEVLGSIFKLQDGKESISPKSSNNELMDFFKKVLPEYDEDRVYPSDVKKLLSWYNLLLENGNLEAPDPTETEEEKEEEVSEEK